MTAPPTPQNPPSLPLHPRPAADALQALAGGRVSIELVAVDSVDTPERRATWQTTVAVTECYRGPGGIAESNVAFTIFVDLFPERGEYSLRYRKDASGAGWSGGIYRLASASSAQTSRGRLIETSSWSEAGPDGRPRKGRFDSREIERRVIETVEAHGWTRPRGFWGRLFG